MHVVGQPPNSAERADLIASIADASHGWAVSAETAMAIAEGRDIAQLKAAVAPEHHDALRALVDTNVQLSVDGELPALLAALDGRYIRPVAGGDVIRSPQILPTGRNLHASIPSACLPPSRWPTESAKPNGS